MASFLLETDISIDSKGRFLLPSAIKRKLPVEHTNLFVMLKGFEGQLVLYPMQTWETKIEPMVSGLNEFSTDARRFKALFFNGATEVEMDSAGRILISKRLSAQCSINPGEAVLIARGESIQIWSVSKYKEFFEHVKEGEMGELADKLLGGNTSL